jgi:hypothetical protein
MTYRRIAICDGEMRGASMGCRKTAAWITGDGKHWCSTHLPNNPDRPWEIAWDARQLTTDEIKPEHEPICPDFEVDDKVDDDTAATQ